MFIVALACILSTAAGQVKHEPVNPTEEHLRTVIAELPVNSMLRHKLLNGVRGNGVHEPWMDDMRREGIKRAVVLIDIHFDRHGRPKKMVTKGIGLFAGYDEGTPISDAERLRTIRSSGLEQILDRLATQRAAHGAWVDLPRPKPQPFVGGVKVEFFDDEWLPTTSAPLYCAGKNCLLEANEI